MKHHPAVDCATTAGSIGLAATHTSVALLTLLSALITRTATDLQVIKRQLEEGVERRRIGLISKGAPARQHSEILTEDGEQVGHHCGCHADASCAMMCC